MCQILTRRIAHQSAALMRGLADLIRPDWLRMFSPDELQMLISGAVGAVDLVDLRANTVYGGGYGDEHPSIQIFWQVLPPAISCCLSECVRLCVCACASAVAKLWRKRLVGMLLTCHS